MVQNFAQFLRLFNGASRLYHGMVFFHEVSMLNYSKNSFLFALLLTCAGGALADDGATRAAKAGRSLIGQPAPGVSLTTLDGRRIELAKTYGKKPVFLKFWATWCSPCREQMPGFARLHQKYGKRIDIIAVNAGFSETESDVRSYVAKHRLAMPVAIDDGSLGRSLNLRVTPQHVLVGLDGRIRHVGHLQNAQLEEALDKALAEQPAPAIASALAGAHRAYRIGDRVGPISLTSTDGKPVALGNRGKPQALVFFSPWCESYLRETRPAISQACRRVREDSGRLARDGRVDWVGISAPLWATAGELAEYGKSHAVPMPLALDTSGNVFAAFGIRGIPSVVLLDAGGRVARVIGPADAGLEQALRSLGSGGHRP
jgi:thiol-disulfide isomerase/thioredoxin